MRALLLVLIGGAICYNYTESATVADAFIKTLVQLPIFVVIAYCYAVARRYCVGRRRWFDYVFNALFALYVVITVAECYLCLFVKSGFTPSILTFLFQTNAGETHGFVQAYLTNKMFFLFVLALLISAVLIGAVSYLAPGRFMPRVFSRWLITICVILAFIFPTYPCTSVSRLAHSLYYYCLGRSGEGELCFDTKIHSACAAPHTVVLIIGEAFSKHHSSLYDYEKQTNPCLEALVKSGNLYPFYDVISPYNKTHMMLKELLSMHSVDASRRWSDYPLWPQIFKEGGYYVSFVSNQVPAAVPNEPEAYFFQNKIVEDSCFNYRNNQAYRYDEGLFNELQMISGVCGHPNELTILHLNGQHIYATYNFPHERFTVFHPSDYIPNNLNLDSRQVQELADYDNATLYNDYVVSCIMRWYEDREAVVVYLSDHGEEVHDYRPFLGRSHKMVPTREELKYQYEIPFMIYMTDKYKRANPDVVRKIEMAQRRRFMSDDLPHMLLGLSGIETGWYDASRDVLAPDFNQSRVRIFGY